ncbi:MAG: hypothetical protein GXO58_06600 [Thermodesulfobacteria bacterium]|nr:hypothetical protein [Thermodesulfobacteriota bacterium]
MKYIKFCLLVVLFFGMFLTTLSTASHAVIVDRIVAVVNGKVITLSELKKRAQPILDKYLSPDMSPEERATIKQKIYAQILPQMIDDYLVEEEINRLGIKVTDQEVEAAIDNICRSNGMTRQEFEERLKKDGISLEDYKKQIATQIERLQLVNAEVKSKIVITDEMVQDYIRKQKGEGGYEGPFYILEHICIVPEGDSPRAKEEARKRAEEALKALEEGMPFEEAARRFSSNVPVAKELRLGVFSLDEMAPSIKDAVKKLSPGEYSEVLETPLGFEILRLAGISNAKGEDLDKATIEEVRRKLYDQEINERFQEWLNELRAKSTIRILL